MNNIKKSHVFINFLKNNIFSLTGLFILVLLVGIFIRIHFFTYPILLNDQAESSRDYLIARHIADFHEFPSVGPWNNALRAFTNSPFYYFWLAFFVFFYDNIIFLGVINILLQIVSATLIFYLGKKMFSPWAGFWSGNLFLFSQLNITQSQAFWQPYAMQPFLILCMFFLYKFYEQKKLKFAILSVLFLVCSIALHNSALAVAPVLISIIIYLLQKNKNSLIDKGIVLFSGFLVFLFCYLSVILYSFKFGWKNIFARFGEYPHTTGNFLFLFIDNIVTLVGNIFPYLNYHSYLGMLSVLVIIIILALLVFRLFSKKFLKQREFIYSLLLLFISVPIFLALYHLNTPNFYFTSSFPAGFLLVGAAVATLSGKLVAKLFQFSLALCILYCSSPHNWNSFGLINSSQDMSNAVYAITNSININGFSIKNVGVSIFEITASNPELVFDNHPALIWAPLEKHFNQALIKLDYFNPARPAGYIPLQGNPSVIFLVCKSELGIERIILTCKDHFLKSWPNYKIQTKIYDTYPFTIFFTTHY